MLGIKDDITRCISMITSMLASATSALDTTCDVPPENFADSLGSMSSADDHRRALAAEAYQKSLDMMVQLKDKANELQAEQADIQTREKQLRVKEEAFSEKEGASRWKEEDLRAREEHGQACERQVKLAEQEVATLKGKIAELQTDFTAERVQRLLKLGASLVYRPSYKANETDAQGRPLESSSDRTY